MDAFVQQQKFVTLFILTFYSIIEQKGQNKTRFT